MKYITSYDDFVINEGFISNKIEKYKSLISDVYKDSIKAKQLIFKVIRIISYVGSAAALILLGILFIHKKFPNFVKICADRAAVPKVTNVVLRLTENENEDSMVKNILNKFYSPKNFLFNLDVNDKSKLNNIDSKIDSLFTREEQSYLKEIL